MTKALKTKSGHSASKTVRSGSAGKLAAGSALSQKPLTKHATITEKKAESAVRYYLSHALK